MAEKVVTEVVVKGLIERDAGGVLALTDRGRSGRCCRTYDGLVGLYPNSRLPASAGPDGKVGPMLSKNGLLTAHMFWKPFVFGSPPVWF